MNRRPLLPNQYFTIANYSVQGMLYDASILFTSNLKLLSSLYLSSASKLKLGCFIAGLPILCPTVHCGLSVVAATIACIVALVASATAFAIASLAIACSFAIFLFVLFQYFVYV